jgi:beta-glucanase (GH16 family)
MAGGLDRHVIVRFTGGSRMAFKVILNSRKFSGVSDSQKDGEASMLRRQCPLALLALSLVIATGCGGKGGAAIGGSTYITQAPTPTITATAAQNGAQVVSFSDSIPNAQIYYTVDGSTPTTSSPIYLAPFLVASNETINAMAVLTGDTNSAVASQTFSANIPSGTLVWSAQLTNTTGANIQPDPTVWTYDTGNDDGWGNGELETYCAWGSTTSPCSTATPNAYIDTDSYLHIVAQQPSAGVYTSARLKTQGLFSFQYGRLEIVAEVPEAQGLWPAAWLMGNNQETVNWPACGEQDVLERVDAAETPDWNLGSVHGPGFTTDGELGTQYNFPTGVTAATWHTYGMIWSPGSVSYYVDDPTQPYVTYTPSSISGISGSVWPFDAGQSNFILLNLAVGGSWPGSPNSSTPFPSEMLIKSVNVYAQ